MVTKKLIFLTSLLFGSALYVSAQQTYVGVSGGYHANGAWIEHSLTGTGYSTQLRQEVIPGFHAGVQLKHYNEAKTYRKLNSGIQVSAYYFERGWQQFYFLTDGPVTRMNYLNLPVDAMLFLGNERNRWYFLAGVYGEWLLNYQAGTEPDSSLTINEDFYTFDASRGDRIFGYGFNGGAGLHKTWGNQSIEIGLFISYSISNFIYTRRLADETPDVSNLWSSGLRIAYLIPLRRD